MSLGPVEIAMLGGAALLLFGPEQFPKVARKAGSFVRDMQTTSQSFIREIERAADLHDAPVGRDDLISAGSGAGPRYDEPSPVPAYAPDPVAETAHHGSPFEAIDDTAYASVEDLVPYEADLPPPADDVRLAGSGSAIDPSALLILTDEGDVRHSVDAGTAPQPLRV